MKLRTRIATAIMAVLMLMSTAMVAFAADSKRIDLGDGFYAIETITVRDLRDGSKSAKKDSTIYYSGDKIGSMTVYASFSYGSAGVSVTSKYCTASSTNGWSYRNNYAVGLYNTATGYCTFSKGTTNYESSVSLYCSNSGVIS